jgi:Uma2 family endonuclease
MTTATAPGPIVVPLTARPVREEYGFSIPPSARNLDGFREWIRTADLPPCFRVSYLAGEVFIEMSPERIGSHSAVKVEIMAVLYRLVQSADLGVFLPDGTLVSNRAADIANEPDALFIAAATLATGRARLVPAADGRDFVEVEGSPDMVLEVISPSSVGKDTVRLREGYHQAGIPEYWLIDARGDDLCFDLFRGTLDGYEPTPATDGWLPSAVFGRRFRLDRARNRFGLWTYALHVAPLDAPAT